MFVSHVHVCIPYVYMRVFAMLVPSFSVRFVLKTFEKTNEGKYKRCRGTLRGDCVLVFGVPCLCVYCYYDHWLGDFRPVSFGLCALKFLKIFLCVSFGVFHRVFTYLDTAFKVSVCILCVVLSLCLPLVAIISCFSLAVRLVGLGSCGLLVLRC